MVGYALVGTALILTTIILLYQAYGFGLKNGEVIQNGLVFMSTTPNPSDIYVNGKKRSEQTNTRLLMPAGQYTFELKRDGYRAWKRAISVEGGSVLRFDYPMLFPTTLQTSVEKKYESQPALATESPDRHWLVTQTGATPTAFETVDLSKPFKTPQVAPFSLPESAIKLTAGTHSWKLVEWSNDNKHILLQHITLNNGQTASEYVLVNRDTPAQSINLTATLGVNPTKISMRDKKFDKYMVYSAEDHTLMTASLDQPKPAAYLDHVLGYKTYGSDVVLYATDKDAPAGKTIIRMMNGDNKVYTIRQVEADSTYMLELTKYKNAWYVVAGVPHENKTYVYKDPMKALDNEPQLSLAPVQILKAVNPMYVAFSDNTRFIMTQSATATQFSVYDAENEKGYTYDTKKPMDAPQEHAYWMDGSRITYISNGKVFVFDFDHTNQQTLIAENPAYRPIFDRDYQMLYAVVQQNVKAADGTDTNSFVLNGAALRTAQDQ